MILILLLVVYSNGDEYACTAPGPECKSTEGTTGMADSTIIYEITDMVHGETVQCYGLGDGYITTDCNNNGWKFYDMGIMKEGDTQEIYWGANWGYPTIKCDGAPSPAIFKWSWKRSSRNIVKCKPPLSCCGSSCFDPKYDRCCGGRNGSSFVCTYPANSCCGNGCFESGVGSCCDDIPCVGTCWYVGNQKQICCANNLGVCCGPESCSCYDETTVQCCRGNFCSLTDTCCSDVKCCPTTNCNC